jgi:GPH family glycoside/pentoside/hexuronide:cation symporter
VPVKTKVAWGLSGVADTFLTYAMATLVMPVFNIGYGINAVWLGYALAVPRVIDMLTDPLMGVISDNTRTRWGRRRPYIFAGGILAAFLFPVIWLPPFEDGTAILLWFVGMMVFMSLAYTVFAVPCMALGFEFTTDYDEKTRIMAWRLYLSVIAGFSVQWLYKLLVLPAFGGTEVDGIRYVGPLIGVIILATSLPAALFCREKVRSRVQEKVAFWEAIRLTFRNRAFLVLMAGYLIIVTSMNTVGSLGLYVNIFYVCGGDKSLAGTIGGWFGTVMIAAAMLSMWLITMISQWTSKRSGILVGLALGILGNLSLWWTMRPEHPYMQLISAFLIGLGGQGCWLMIDSMVADTCDDDEVRTGLRREGAYSAAKGFCMKAALTITAITAGYMLAFAGYEENVSPPEEVTLRMKTLLIGVQVSGLALALLLFFRYPLTRQIAEENQRILTARAKSATPA